MLYSRGDRFQGLLGEYTIQRKIGKGAYGQTYLGKVTLVRRRKPKTRRLQQGQLVAIKVPPLLNPRRYNESERKQFLREVDDGFRSEYQLVDRFRGVSSAADVLDCGAVDVVIGAIRQACFFVVYEFVKGQDLKQFMTGRGRIARPVKSADEFFVWARKLTEGLDQIHQKSVVHNDIWPPNIMVRDVNRAIVYVDFGQAALRDAVLAAKLKPASHPFIAPEHEKSVPGDIYSLCAVLFYLATGKAQNVHKFTDRDDLKREVVRILQNRNKVLYGQNSGIADIITRGLRHAKEQRTQDCGQLLIDIELFERRPSRKRPAAAMRSALRTVESNIPELVKREPLFARMILRRFRWLKRQVEDMLNGYQVVRGDHWTMVVTLSQYLSTLERGDVYLTATFPLAWREDNLGVNGRFLTMNETIIKRRVTVRRVFVITPKEGKTSWVLDILKAHAAMLDRLDRARAATRVKTGSKSVASGGVFTGVVVIKQHERDALFENNPHAGIWISKSKVKLVLPEYDQKTGVMRVARLTPGEGNPALIKERFEEVFLDRAVELRLFLRDILDLDVMADRRGERSRPFRDYLSKKNAR